MKLRSPLGNTLQVATPVGAVALSYGLRLQKETCTAAESAKMEEQVNTTPVKVSHRRYLYFWRER